MQQQHTDGFDPMPMFRMHEALTPQLLREIYAEDQLPMTNPLLSLMRYMGTWLKSKLQMF